MGNIKNKENKIEIKQETQQQETRGQAPFYFIMDEVKREYTTFIYYEYTFFDSKSSMTKYLRQRKYSDLRKCIKKGTAHFSNKGILCPDTKCLLN